MISRSEKPLPRKIIRELAISFTTVTFVDEYFGNEKVKSLMMEIHEKIQHPHFNKDELELYIARIFSIDPENSYCYYFFGDFISLKGDYEQAVEYYNMSVKLGNTSDAKLFQKRGFLNIKLERYRQAMFDLNMAIHLAPDWKSYIIRCLLHDILNRPGNMISDAIQAVKLNRNKLEERAPKILAHLMYPYKSFSGLDRDLVLDFIKLLGPEKFQLLQKCINKKTRLGHYMSQDPEVLEKLEYCHEVLLHDNAVNLHPNDFRNYSNRADFYIKKGDDSKALDDLNLIIRKKGRTNCLRHDALKKRGDIFRKQGDYEKALEDYNGCFSYIQLPDASYPAIKKMEVTLARGLTFKCLGKFNKAIEDFSVIIDSCPTHKQALQNRGNLFLMQKKMGAAIKDYYIIYISEPDDMENFKQLENLLLNITEGDDLSGIDTRTLFAAIEKILPPDKANPRFYKGLFKGNVFGNKMWENVSPLREKYGSPYDNEDSVLYLICKYLELNDEDFVSPRIAFAKAEKKTILTTNGLFKGLKKVEIEEYMKKENDYEKCRKLDLHCEF